jgi:xanthine dehydrogenase YagS FAD-binding subunit
VSLAGIPELRGIREAGGGLELGAMTTIAELASHPIIRARYAALAQAAEELATPQIRNLGTLGGNLAQRPRCWYYRHPQTVCLKKGGDRCYALAGVSKYLCVTGGDRCYIVHPSDTAVALSVFDAQVEIAGPAGTRVVPVGEFFTGPGQDLRRENVLAPGELVARVVLPAATPHPGLLLQWRGSVRRRTLPW